MKEGPSIYRNTICSYTYIYITIHKRIQLRFPTTTRTVTMCPSFWINIKLKRTAYKHPHKHSFRTLFDRCPATAYIYVYMCVCVHDSSYDLKPYHHTIRPLFRLWFFIIIINFCDYTTQRQTNCLFNNN